MIIQEAIDALVGGPLQVLPNGAVVTELMSLRDWLAGQALAGNLAGCGDEYAGFKTASNLAANCYRIADAMLAARQPKPQPENQ